jgi:hypothetical protein
VFERGLQLLFLEVVEDDDQAALLVATELRCFVPYK